MAMYDRYPCATDDTPTRVKPNPVALSPKVGPGHNTALIVCALGAMFGRVPGRKLPG